MKIALLGYGTMGREIEQIALERGHHIVFKSTRNTSAKELKTGLLAADVAIEFSTPQSANELISAALLNGIPVVSGTTGWLAHWDDVNALRADKKGALFYASNFSLGVNLFFALNKKMANLMNGQSEYDVQMIETHHTRKKDAPSGTAITLAEQIIEKIDRKDGWLLGKPEATNQLSIRSERIDDVPGMHEIIYESDIDIINLRHEAKSRKGFALGAVVAAEWVPGKTGTFGMNDLLNL